MFLKLINNVRAVSCGSYFHKGFCSSLSETIVTEARKKVLVLSS